MTLSTLMVSPRVQRLQLLLFDSGSGDAYALLDAARSANLWRWIQQCEMPCRSLYAGTAAITLAEQAPYLVRLLRDSASLADLLEFGWGQSLGIFLQARTDFESLRIALKKKLVLRSATGQRQYFRFYDPRVARAFLATADGRGLRWWFEGGIERCLIEASNGQALLLDRNAASAKDMQRIDVPGQMTVASADVDAPHRSTEVEPS